MKAAIYDHPGPLDVLRYVDVADPVCPSDGVLIRVEAAAIEGGDLINRASTPPPPDRAAACWRRKVRVAPTGSQARHNEGSRRIVLEDRFRLCARVVIVFFARLSTILTKGHGRRQ